MTLFIAWTLGFYGTLLIGYFYLMARMNKVYNFRKGLIDQVFSFDDWQWRLKAFESVKHTTMIFSFKRIKPESFYKDTSFLAPYTGPMVSPIGVLDL